MSVPTPLSAPAHQDQVDVPPLQRLLDVGLSMMEREDTAEIVRLAADLGAAVGECIVLGAMLTATGWIEPAGSCTPTDEREDLEAQLAALGDEDGSIALNDQAWGWALALRTASGHLGHLVVAAGRRPSDPELRLLRAVAHETGIALTNARSHVRERDAVTRLLAVNTELNKSVAALERSNAIHHRLTLAAFEGGGQQRIADTLHELTGHPVAIEDAYGNLRAWAGAAPPVAAPKDPPDRRAELLRRAERSEQPLRDGARLVTVSGHGDRCGLLALCDGGAAGPEDEVALQHAARVLEIELLRQQEAAADDRRQRRELVEELLTGADEEHARTSSQTLGYDLERPHRVLVVSGGATHDADDALFRAVDRAARNIGLATLTAARGAEVAVLVPEDAPTDRSWERLRDDVQRVVRHRCRVGVGGRCARIADFPRSLRQAQLAVQIQDATNAGPRVAVYEELGVYRLFGELTDLHALEDFVVEWLGPLIDYDEKKHSELVFTLDRYLAAGGNYEASAQAIGAHRSTLKYRLQRIRDISRLDLSDPDTAFHLQLATRAWTTLLALRDLPRRGPADSAHG